MKTLALFAFALAVAGAQTSPRIVWEARPGFRDFGGIAVSGDTVVSGNITGAGGIFAFDGAPGKLLWGTRGKAMKGQPAVDAQSVYVVTNVDGIHYRLSSLTLKTGKLNWSVEDEGLGNSDGSPVVSGGLVYVIHANGKASAYAAATGKPAWETRYSPGKGNCPTAASLAGGVLYFGGGDFQGNNSQGRFLWALDAASGKELWRYQVMPDPYTHGGACLTAPAAAGGTVVTSAENVLFALDARTGALRWKQEVRGLLDGRERAQKLSDLVISGTVVYGATPIGLGGWSLATGKREFDLPGKFGVDAGIYRMAIAGGVLYFIADLDPPGENAIPSPLCALDLTTRQILWKHRTNRPSRFASVAQWRTRWILPVDGAVYYENESILVKLQ